jgi:hypothetical protein
MFKGEEGGLVFFGHKQKAACVLVQSKERVSRVFVYKRFSQSYSE